jgi:hypothetical protein
LGTVLLKSMKGKGGLRPGDSEALVSTHNAVKPKAEKVRAKAGADPIELGRDKSGPGQPVAKKVRVRKVAKGKEEA